MKTSVKASTEADVWEEALELHRAFKAAIHECKTATNEQQQLESLRRLAMLTLRVTKIAKKLAANSEYAAKVLTITRAMTDEAYELAKSPALSKFIH